MRARKPRPKGRPHLVSHDENILLSLKFHNHRFQPDHDVSVRFAPYASPIHIISHRTQLGELLPKTAGGEAFLNAGREARTSISIIELVVVPIGKVLRVRTLHLK